MRASIVYGRVMPVLLIMLCFCYTSSYVIDGGRYSERTRGGSSVVIKYNRIDEAKKECSFLLNSASDMKPTDDIVYSLKEELSFLNGDWWQESNKAPLMPFDNTNYASNSSQAFVSGSPSNPFNSSFSDPRSSNLVSFWVTDVSTARRSKNWIAVNGAMMIGITTQSLFLERPYEGSHFDIWSGQSQLTIGFQGFYAESGENGGERVMCLLGSAMLPSRQSGSDDPWEWLKPGYNNQPPLVEDDRILLVLRYPKTFSLLNRGIQGSMKSLDLKSKPSYFDEVGISSWLGANAIYAFGSEETVSRACEPYPSKDILVNGDLEVYKGLDICLLLEKFTPQDGFRFAPNWKCNGTDEYCSKLGPFGSDYKVFKDFKLVIQDFRCSEEASQDEVGFRRISSVFRAFPISQEIFFASQRTDLSDMTVTAEGIWKSSSGQVCMVGCLGGIHHGDCNLRICLYAPVSFSINQRSIVMGTFTSLDGSINSYFPLTFQNLARPGEFWNQYSEARSYYKYSKTDAARVIMEKDEPFNLGNTVKKSLLKFPQLEEAESSHVSLSLLSEDLSLHISAVPDPSPESFISRTNLQVEILSLGPLFGRYWSSNSPPAVEEKPYHSEGDVSDKQLPVNVSGQIDLFGGSYDNFSALFVEGLYNPQVGKMYLIGCREVQSSWKILHESSMDLEAGLDCRVEVIVSYPPTTSRWLVNPTAWISISSQRNEDDPLYFKPVKLQTLPVVYRKQREDILSRRGIEGLLRILTLSVAIASLLSQILFIRKSLESVPYISLVMLGIQGVGYSIPLITGAEAIFEKMGAESDSYENRSYEQLQKGLAIRIVEYMVKLLVLVAFSLTMRLCQKVWRSRIRLLTRTPLEPHRVPSDKRVFLITLILHTAGYSLVLLVHSLTAIHRPPRVDKFIDSSGHSRTLHEWLTELEEYFGLIQDCFLLPQIIGNHAWRLHGKPLRKLYYMGITAVRLLPHVYDLSRSRIPNPYFSNEYEFLNPNLGFFSKFGDIAIPLAAVVLAVVVYVQQRWNYVEISESIGRGAKVYERLGSKVYERLPSMNFEAEMSSGANDVIRSDNGHV